MAEMTQMAQKAELIALLQEILREGPRRKELVERFQQQVWQASSGPSATPLPASLADLAHDLDYYEGDSSIRKEDPAFYGDERLVAEITEVLRGLGVEGVG